ncbi:CYTH domain-containing protein [Dasania sp. GY-MA-18]|uniref:CYTH domain-containing protein n=1 Tax=Dasania phycosphaerae TaxID=2950436 RepID=A0A9J6RJ49_9GAMM|nr:MULTISPECIES: CYTH domain-containing protein [Dasania]MCR8922055.1 CYTH domain-containing protein [Dasania sp. GY-MA-18]MCZ0864483.1 CYTH domain-containing protein [Dasania phycosphaerae]MCZ0868211.1 CYTH domain-containing protein [Dasania phycosphaerae]
MAKEIERKFLVDSAKLCLPENGVIIKQGYIATASKTAVRIRVKGEQAFLTLKGENRGAVRSEFEYPIPMADAQAMLTELCQRPYIDKTRYEIPLGSHIWEVDIFHGDNQGLCVAEIELGAEDEVFAKPQWLSQEVTGDARYYNSSLVKQPYSLWPESNNHY